MIEPKGTYTIEPIKHEIKSFKFIQIQTSWQCRLNFPDGHYVPTLKWLWGIDIWLNNIPLLKSFALINALVTTLIVWGMR